MPRSCGAKERKEQSMVIRPVVIRIRRVHRNPGANSDVVAHYHLSWRRRHHFVVNDRMNGYNNRMSGYNKAATSGHQDSKRQ